MAAARLYAPLVTRRWPPQSHLFLVEDRAGWAITEEARQLRKIARALGIRLAPQSWMRGAAEQGVYYGEQFVLMRPLEPCSHARGVAYLHGLPKTPSYPQFDRCFETLCRQHEDLSRVHVSHTQMHEVVLSSGIDPAKVFQIPLGVDLERLRPPTDVERARLRKELGLPASAFVVGSFQKDGEGWGEGLEPKAIKGPDLLVKTMRRLHRAVPELWVLLCGPARGFVRAGLRSAGIPHVHVQYRSLERVAKLYGALDLYVVSSRQEGGPKAVLDAMATRVPLVTTEVGQAMDLVEHQRNAWMVDVEDVDGLVHWSLEVSRSPSRVRPVLDAAQRTAEANSYRAQIPLWHEFFAGLTTLARPEGA
jgi:glycosyltransferase involved in cell wall biosynthesis